MKYPLPAESKKGNKSESTKGSEPELKKGRKSESKRDTKSEPNKVTKTLPEKDTKSGSKRVRIDAKIFTSTEETREMKFRKSDTKFRN